eukprot:6472607-Amphidinium_carterae.1
MVADSAANAPVMPLGGTAVADSAAAVPGRSGASSRDGDASEMEEGMEESMVVARGLPVPITPTEAQIREHEVTHLPYRSWCVACV